ncbi:MAG: apolipoprotein N-acyltransferase [Acidobacteria bacterium]|nr:apolipoprotein N-acyltransferase [Acidobacteriota bacterium]
MTSRSSAYLHAAASGVLLALSFPRFGHPSIAWVALVPLLVALPRSPSLMRAFLLGLATGLVYFAGTLYWITRVMAVYGGMPAWVAMLVNAALIAYLALYPAIFALVVRRLFSMYGPLALLASPLVWVATELGRTHLFTGFPWVLLGYSQTTVLPVAQLASVFGVYGLSALVAGTSASIALVVERSAASSRRLVIRRGGRLVQARPALIAIGVVLAVAAWGGARIGRGALTRAGEGVRIGIVQGNVAQEQKTNGALAPAIFQNYLRMTREAAAQGARLVVWPESSAPFMFEEDTLAADQVRALARETGAALLFGSDEIERGEAGDRYYNSAFLVRPDGTTGGVYRKIHLVPFGEYVPARTLFFFAAPLVETISDFAPGTRAVLLPLGQHPISTAICYEIVYPDLVRQFVRGGSELLTTITNDAWFGPTSAPYQHFAQASMRAIEEGRYLVRSANTGISGIVDPYGRVLVQTPIFEPAVRVGEVRLLTSATVYSRIGDVFAYASALATAVLLVASRRRVQYGHADR